MFLSMTAVYNQQDFRSRFQDLRQRLDKHAWLISFFVPVSPSSDPCSFAWQQHWSIENEPAGIIEVFHTLQDVYDGITVSR